MGRRQDDPHRRGVTDVSRQRSGEKRDRSMGLPTSRQPNSCFVTDKTHEEIRLSSWDAICGYERKNVRFTPMCGRLRVGKDFLHVCSIGRCAHVFGLCVRHTRPLAIMPSADQVPINNPHSTMLGGNWVVLIAGSTGSALRAVRPPNVHITPDVRRDLGYAASATGCL